MATPLRAQECESSCKEVTEFSLKFIITSLVLSDKDKNKGFEEILFATTFEGNVFKIENFEENENGEVKLVGRELFLQVTPDELSHKLQTNPIMFDLSRGCNELGTLKLEITDCFADAVRCEEFSAETVTNDFLFVKDGTENATMTLVFQVSRPVNKDSVKLNNLFRRYAKKKSEKLKKIESAKTETENYSSCFDDSESNITCETDLCPIDEESEERPTTSFPLTSSNKSKSSRSKCCSDIATSLAIHDFPDQQKTFCNGCGGISISGITCDNKLLFIAAETPTSYESSPCKSDVNDSIKPCKTPCKSSSQRSIASLHSSARCKKSIARICSECFEDLTAMPEDSTCPKCIHNANLQRKLVSFKSEHVKGQETQKVRDCIKSIFEEIFLEAKDRLVNDWERLNLTRKKKGKKSSSVNKICNMRTSVDSKLKSMPR